MNGAEHKQAGSRRQSFGESSDSENEGGSGGVKSAAAGRANGNGTGASQQQQQSGAGGASPPGAESSAVGSGSEKKKLNRREKRALKSKHRKINKQHPEFELTYDMMLGIRTVVGNNPTGHMLAPAAEASSAASGTPVTAGAAPNGLSTLAGAQAEAARRRRTREAEAALAAQKSSKTASMLKLSFPGKGSSLTPAHAMRDFKFKDYCGDVFRDIRARFKIDPTEYLLCVCGNFQYLEFISNSKSGQFFFYSHDRRYMIKTISGGECKFLRTILPSYLEHIKANPHTLLTRFYGMHRVKPHKKKQVHFLIMGSCFATQRFVHTVFDLKGSRQGRNATQKEKDSGAAVYKDNDFVDMGITIKLGAERTRLLNEQIGRDVEYLRRLNIMDYSLLLGIHYKDRAGDVYGPVGAAAAAPGDAASALGSAGYNGASGSALNSVVSPVPAAGGAGAAGGVMSPATANATREGMAGLTGDELGPGGSGVGSYHAVRVADLLSGEDGDDFNLPPQPHIAEEDEGQAEGEDAEREHTHTQTRTDGGDEGIYTQLHPRTTPAHQGGAAGMTSAGRAGFASGAMGGDETSHLDPHSHQRPFLDSDLGFIGMTPTHKGQHGVQRSPTAASTAGRRLEMLQATPSAPAHAHLGSQSLPPTPAHGPAPAVGSGASTPVLGSPTPPSPAVHGVGAVPSSPPPAVVAEGEEGEGEGDASDGEIEVHFHDEFSPRASVALPLGTQPQHQQQQQASVATLGTVDRRPSVDASSSGLTTPQRPTHLSSGSNDVAAGGASPRTTDLRVAPGATPTHGAHGQGEGGFSSRTWNGQVAAPGSSGPPSARTARSQSVLAQQGSMGSGFGMAQSPTTAAAAAHAASKKELAAAAKLDAIAKQTAYGLPKKYNKVSKPGDIAFPFEFEESANAGAAVQPVAGSSSPVPAYGGAHPHSPRTMAATLPAPITSLGSPAHGSAATPQQQHGRTRTADSTPVLQALATPAGAGVSGPALDDPSALEPLPPSASAAAALEAPADSAAGVSVAAPLTPSRAPRALSLFASPKDAQSFYAAQRGISHSGSGPRSLLSPLAAGLGGSGSPGGPTPFVLQMPSATGTPAAAAAGAAAPSSASVSASAAPAAALAPASSSASASPAQPQGLASASPSSPALGAAATPGSPAQMANPNALGSGLLSASAHAATAVGSSPRPSPRLSLSLPALHGAFPLDTHAVPYHAAPAAVAAAPAPAAAASSAPAASAASSSSASAQLHADPIPAAAAVHSSSSALASADEHKSSSPPQSQDREQSSVDPVDPDDKLGLFSTDGGCAGQNPDGTPNNELYFMGIIDILTLYNVGKKLENFGKSLKYNEADISAVNPTKYADRFKAFIEHALR